MKVLFYSSSKAKACKRAIDALLTVIPEDSLETCHTLRSLSQRLMEPLGNLSIAVLYIATQKELSSLLIVKDLLKDMRIILILPDGEKATISKGHSLRARFISDKDSDFSNVAAVLHNMVEKMDIELGSYKNCPSLQDWSRGSKGHQ